MLDLLEEFERIISLSDETKLRILRCLKECHYRRKDYLLEAGQTCRYLYFVRKGAVNGYFHYRGRVYTTRLTHSGQLSFVPESFLQQIPSKLSLQALSPCLAYALSYAAVQELCRLQPKFQAVIDHYVRNDYLDVVQCLYMLRSLDGVHRYRWLVEHHADFLEHFSYKTLSSYLGMSDRSIFRCIQAAHSNHPNGSNPRSTQ